MTRGRWIGLGVVLFLLLFSQAAWSQTTGSIRGRTVDADGQALPGVTIVVTGEILGSAQRTAVTSPSGGYQFVGLPIGTYIVEADLAGFQKQAAENVRVAIGKVTSVDFTMTEAFSDEITVIGETPIVDVASPSFNAAYDADTIKDLPTRGNFYDTLSVFPGVATDRESIFLLTAFGSDVQSNQWNIDGLDSTSPESGDLYWSMNDEVVPADQLMDRTRAVAQDLLRAAPLSLAAVKEAVHLTENLSFEESHAALRSRSWPAFMKMLESSDSREGARAFIEKREPEWKGQ